MVQRRIPGGRIAARYEVQEQIAVRHGLQVTGNELPSDHLYRYPRVGSTVAAARAMRVFPRRTVGPGRAEFRYPYRFAKMWWSLPYSATSVGFVSQSKVRDIAPHGDAVAL